MTNEQLINQAKVICSLYHKALDRSLTYRSKMNSYIKGTPDYFLYLDKVVEYEAKCIELDTKLTEVVYQLRNSNSK